MKNTKNFTGRSPIDFYGDYLAACLKSITSNPKRWKVDLSDLIDKQHFDGVEYDDFDIIIFDLDKRVVLPLNSFYYNHPEYINKQVGLILVDDNFLWQGVHWDTRQSELIKMSVKLASDLILDSERLAELVRNGLQDVIIEKCLKIDQYELLQMDKASTTTSDDFNPGIISGELKDFCSIFFESQDRSSQFYQIVTKKVLFSRKELFLSVLLQGLDYLSILQKINFKSDIKFSELTSYLELVKRAVGNEVYDDALDRLLFSSESIPEKNIILDVKRVRAALFRASKKISNFPISDELKIKLSDYFHKE